MPLKTYYVYMLASQKYGTLYIGVTNNLLKRIYQHKENLIEGFTKQYGVQLRSDDENNARIFSSLRNLANHVQQYRIK